MCISPHHVDFYIAAVDDFGRYGGPTRLYSRVNMATAYIIQFDGFC
jgi:hypothetical protein